jgi:pyruvate dehydrogenase E1 component alpha subunit
MYDPELYRDKAEVAAWKEQDPIDLLVARLRADGELDDAALAAMEADVAAEVDDAVAYAEAGTPEPVEQLERDLYAEVG